MCDLDRVRNRLTGANSGTGPAGAGLPPLCEIIEENTPEVSAGAAWAVGALSFNEEATKQGYGGHVYLLLS